jgi:hypothetical protein
MMLSKTIPAVVLQTYAYSTGTFNVSATPILVDGETIDGLMMTPHKPHYPTPQIWLRFDQGTLFGSASIQKQ